MTAFGGCAAAAVGSTLRGHVTTDDSEARRELEALRARYEAMVEHAPEAIVTFEIDSGHFTEVNHAACELFGRSREELLALSPWEVSPPAQPDGAPSDAAAMTHVQAAMRGELPSFEWMHVTREGAPIPCRVQLALVPGARPMVRGAIWDLRELKSAERERNRLREIAEVTPDLIGMADAEGRTLYINPAGRRLIGYGVEDDLSRVSIADYHPPAVALRIMHEILPGVAKKGLWRGESVVLHADGSEIPVDQTLLAHYDDEGGVDYFSTIMRDRRGAVAAEELERQMLHAQKLESLGLMAGAIAHDFNNILVAILANASLLRRLCAEDASLTKVAREIEGAADRAAELAKGMLDYSGHSRREMEAIALPRVLEELSTLVTASISKKVRLRTELAAELPPAWADGGQLRQVLVNLVLNGAEAIGDGAGTVLVRAGVDDGAGFESRYDYRSPEVEGPWVRIDVEDDGCGMSAELLDRVFDPFYSTKRMGRGLGLASVLGIVKGHSGAIGVEPRPEGGTCFSLLLPVAPHEPQRVQAEPTGQRVDGVGRRILVVDDEAAVRSVARRCLMYLGFDVVETGGPIEALERFVEAPAEWDAVLLDLTMPELSGIQILQRMLEVRPTLPVLLSSGYLPPESMDELGANVAFLAKPYTLRSLEHALGELIPLATAETRP